MHLRAHEPVLRESNLVYLVVTLFREDEGTVASEILQDFIRNLKETTPSGQSTQIIFALATKVKIKCILTHRQDFRSKSDLLEYLVPLQKEACHNYAWYL